MSNIGKKQYIQICDAVCAELHCNMGREMGEIILVQQILVWQCTEIGINRS